MEKKTPMGKDNDKGIAVSMKRQPLRGMAKQYDGTIFY